MFVFAVRFILAAGLVFFVINIFAPVIYSVWYDDLRDGVTNPRLQAAGDTFFGNFIIMSYVVPGLIIAWGFLVAQNKRVVEREDI